MYQRLQCHACCRVFDHLDELQSPSTIWCPFCAAVYIWPAEREQMFEPHPGAGRTGGKYAFRTAVHAQSERQRRVTSNRRRPICQR